ncbi:MAG: transposase, partial [Candidatus Hydrogenedentes bacterium]|nr:transposase [Candidatus Hydrogenedentota bacterium]
GNNRQQVFFFDADRSLYLELLKEHAELFGLEVLGYCLMSNHMHLVAIPAAEDSLAKAVGRTDFRYTQAVNRSRGWSGHLWQNRFHSCPLERVHQWQALAYVDLNTTPLQKLKKL